MGDTLTISRYLNNKFNNRQDGFNLETAGGNAITDL